MRLVFLKGPDQLLGRHFDAEIDDVIAVVLEDDLDQILPDIVHIAFDRGQDHLGPLLDVGLFHKPLQITHRSLHGLGGLQDLGDDELVVVEAPADLGHPLHQRSIDDVERRGALLELMVEVLDQAFLGALENIVGQPLVEREIGRAGFLFFLLGAEVRGDGGDVELVDSHLLLAGLRSPIGRRVAKQRSLRVIGGHANRNVIEQEVFSELALRFGDRGEALEALGIDDGQIQAGLGAVVEENRVDDFPGAGRKAEGDVGDPQNSAREGNVLLDQAQGLDRLHGAADIVLVACGAGEDQRVEDDVLRRDPIFLGEELIGALGDGELALARERLGLRGILVNATHNDGRAIGASQRGHLLEFFFAVFQVDGVDDALALTVSESKLDGPRIGGVDHDGDLDLADQLFVEGRDIPQFLPLGALQADVHDVGAVLDLATRDLGGFLPLFGADQLLEEPRADHVGALADQQRAGAFLSLDHLDPRIDGAAGILRGMPGPLALRHLGDGPDVLFRRAAAAAH